MNYVSHMGMPSSEEESSNRRDQDMRCLKRQVPYSKERGRVPKVKLNLTLYWVTAKKSSCFFPRKERELLYFIQNKCQLLGKGDENVVEVIGDITMNFTRINVNDLIYHYATLSLIVTNRNDSEYITAADLLYDAGTFLRKCKLLSW